MDVATALVHSLPSGQLRSKAGAKRLRSVRVRVCGARVCARVCVCMCVGVGVGVGVFVVLLSLQGTHTPRGGRSARA